MIVADLQSGDRFGQQTVAEIELTAIKTGERFVDGAFEDIVQTGRQLTFEDGTTLALGDNFEVPEADDSE